MKKNTFLSMLLTTVSLLGSSLTLNAQMLDMVKNMIRQFDELKPGDFENDEIIQNSVPFPLEGTLNENLYKEALKETEKLFEITDFQNGYTEIDEKEYPMNCFTLEFSYLSLPCFQGLNAWYENVMIKDLAGKDLLMKEKEVEKYRELGIIEDGFSFPMPGTYSEVCWLNREPAWEERIDITGTIKLEYPEKHELAIISETDTLQWYEIGEISWKLIDMEKNIATVLLKGDRRKVEGVKIIVLNKDNLPFGSTSSTAIDANMYDIKSKSVKQFTDAELQKSIDDYDMTNTNIYQVKKIEVNGNINKLALLKVTSTENIEQTFKVGMTVTY